MKIIIDIPEVFYEALRKTDEIISGQRSGKTLMSVIYNAVAQGTPLPKGHGELIDRGQALNECYRITVDGDVFEVVQYETLLGVPTIIEADKE